MYRQYEDPYKIHNEWEKAKAAYEAAKMEEPDNIELLVELSNEVESLRQRENFAWQDDEYEVEGYDY